MMQDKVGILRTNDEIASAIEGISAFSQRAAQLSLQPIPQVPRELVDSIEEMG